jgi:hypothetical protein
MFEILGLILVSCIILIMLIAIPVFIKLSWEIWRE